ncbi:uncharacterized protein B0P05DRAFT_564545 [Gilbertella persicaria]|uniref:uncharacterized protein n=1 Tax=Gilbertella persicaria TaxID=101096 RepID=UPI00221E3BCB|nr:uncharacterized protein B0P05DRAFT_564545 [Gilbertella persicaria]KAI8048342.1 hypothetical protein B0P05DRAFT_564545 [Gilbertella persicaria]
MKTIAFILSLLFTAQAISFNITATASLSHPTPVVCAMTVCPSVTALVARDLVCPENCKDDCKIIDDVCCPGNQKAICDSSSNATSTSWVVSALTSTALPTSSVASVVTSAVASSAVASSTVASSTVASSTAPAQPTQSNTTSGAGKTAIMWSGVCFMMLVIVQVL